MTIATRYNKQRRQLKTSLKAARAPLQAEARRLGITHDKIAALAECHRTSVVQYFSGSRSPKAVELGTLILIAEAKTAAGEGGKRDRRCVGYLSSMLRGEGLA